MMRLQRLQSVLALGEYPRPRHRTFQEYTQDRDMHVLEAAGIARVKRMFWGDLPAIHSVGIMTAQNPLSKSPTPTAGDVAAADSHRARGKAKSRMGDKTSPVWHANRRLNQELYDTLRRSSYGPIKIKGSFDRNKEDSFLIPNISKEELIFLGKRFDQDAVIWGQKKIDAANNPYFQFEYIVSDTGNTISTRAVHVSGPDVQKRSDMYSLIRGKKFIIPFFDEDHEFKVPAKERGKLVDLRPATMPPDPEQLASLYARELPGKVKAETFFIPPIDDLQAEWEYMHSRNEISYYSDRLPNDPNTHKLVEQIKNSSDALLTEGKLNKYYWHHRSIIQESMKGLGREPNSPLCG